MTTHAECARSTSRGRIAKAPVAAKVVWAASKVATSAPDDSPNPVEPVVSTASLESILRTDELHRRPWRAPNYETENRALVALTSALTDSPGTILQTLAEKVLEVLPADSAGLSLLTKDEKRFYWAAIAGAWQPHIGGGTPRYSGPCGDVLDRKTPMLFTHWERRYPYLLPATPLAEEGLLVPFYVNGKAVGTIWAIAHSERRRFDAEDLRLLESLGRFASVAYQAVASIDDLKFQIAKRDEAEAAVRELATGLQAKIRSLVDSNIIGIFIWELDGRITDANDAFLRIVEYERGALVGGRLSWKELTPPEWRAVTEQRRAQLQVTGASLPYEKEYFRKDGSRVPVLVGHATFERKLDQGVAFVLDLTDQKRAERAYTQVQTELTHANRVATMGHLTASIAHEINQPMGAAIAYANAALNWLCPQRVNLDEARRALGRIVEAGIRASDVVDRIRSLVKKAPPRKDRLDINEALLEIVELTREQTAKNAISVQMELAERLPAIKGDRVQLQQVILNLLINAIEAMSGMLEGPRQLLISTREAEAEGVLVAVRDSGPGLAPESADRLFESFYTTKPGGLGMGLSISHSIIEAHQGRLWAGANTPQGAVLQFTLPAYADAEQSDA
jgi:PAS domain S-box-containing protein